MRDWENSLSSFLCHQFAWFIVSFDIAVQCHIDYKHISLEMIIYTWNLRDKEVTRWYIIIRYNLISLIILRDGVCVCVFVCVSHDTRWLLESTDYHSWLLPSLSLSGMHSVCVEWDESVKYLMIPSAKVNITFICRARRRRRRRRRRAETTSTWDNDNDMRLLQM